MEKKWFVALLMVVVMMCACWTGAVADEERKTFTSGDYQYALLDDGTVEIAGYKGSADLLAIPAELDGKAVTSIGDCAFYLCSSLTSVSIPDSVEQIGTNPFAACFELKTISVSPEHPYFATIDGVLFRKADKALISYPASISSSTYTIPQGITSIGDSAFFYCDSLTSVSIPDSITAIGDSAFFWCSSLTSVSIPDSVTSIGNRAFYYCDSLTSVSIPDSVTSIGDEAFYSCSSLTSVNIPDSVTSIGDRAFYYCDSLTSVSIPDSVTSIGNRAFYYCDSLTSVSIPDSVTSIGDYAFGDCSNLTLTVPRNSYAAEYAKTNNIPYTYPDANDWLNN